MHRKRESTLFLTMHQSLIETMLKYRERGVRLSKTPHPNRRLKQKVLQNSIASLVTENMELRSIYLSPTPGCPNQTGGKVFGLVVLGRLPSQGALMSCTIVYIGVSQRLIQVLPSFRHDLTTTISQNSSNSVPPAF